MSNITFQFAHQDQLPAILEISNQTFHEHSKRNPKDFGNSKGTNSLDRIFKACFTKTRISENIIVCMDGTKVVGHIFYLIMDQPQTYDRVYEREATILDISFAPEYRGQKLGKRALEHLLPILQERNITRIEAQIWTGNTASEALFETMDFYTAHQTVRRRLNEPRPLPTLYQKWRTIFIKDRHTILLMISVLVAILVVKL